MILSKRVGVEWWYGYGYAILSIVEGVASLITLPFGWGVELRWSYVYWASARRMMKKARLMVTEEVIV